MFFTTQLPDSYADTVAEEMQQQDFHPSMIEGDAYSSNLVKDGGSAVNGMYIELGYVLYLGADGNLPAVKLFTKWMKKADPNANFELQSLYGWASAQLFVQALKDAGNPPTRAGLEAALDKVTSFNASGILTTGDPAGQHPRRLRPLGPGPERPDRPGGPHAQERPSSARGASYRRRDSSRRSGRPPRRRVPA